MTAANYVKLDEAIEHLTVLDQVDVKFLGLIALAREQGKRNAIISGLGTQDHWLRWRDAGFSITAACSGGESRVYW